MADNEVIEAEKQLEDAVKTQKKAKAEGKTEEIKSTRDARREAEKNLEKAEAKKAAADRAASGRPKTDAQKMADNEVIEAEKQLEDAVKTQKKAKAEGKTEEIKSTRDARREAEKNLEKAEAKKAAADRAASGRPKTDAQKMADNEVIEATKQLEDALQNVRKAKPEEIERARQARRKAEVNLQNAEVKQAAADRAASSRPKTDAQKKADKEVSEAIMQLDDAIKKEDKATAEGEQGEIERTQEARREAQEVLRKAEEKKVTADRAASGGPRTDATVAQKLADKEVIDARKKMKVALENVKKARDEGEPREIQRTQEARRKAEKDLQKAEEKKAEVDLEEAKRQGTSAAGSKQDGESSLLHSGALPKEQ